MQMEWIFSEHSLNNWYFVYIQRRTLRSAGLSVRLFFLLAGFRITTEINNRTIYTDPQKNTTQSFSVFICHELPLGYIFIDNYLDYN